MIPLPCGSGWGRPASCSSAARCRRARRGRARRVLGAAFSYRSKCCAPLQESREVFGVRLTQDRDQTPLPADLLQVVTGPPLTETAVSDLLLGMAVLRYTQSNSVCSVHDGMTLGIGAGQQSRVDCTRLADAGQPGRLIVAWVPADERPGIVEPARS
jgi:AICAR transformylase/IMP cyclohydrolase PurH